MNERLENTLATISSKEIYVSTDVEADGPTPIRITTAHLRFAGDLEQQIDHQLIEIVFGAIRYMQLMLAGLKEGRLIAR